MRIEKDNIIIRSASLNDVKILNTWWNDGSVMEHAGFPNGLGESLGKTKENVRRMMGRLNHLCLIEIDGKRVGELNYRIDKKDRIASVGWKLCDEDYQNKGYGSKVIKMTLDYIFTDRHINNYIRIDKITWNTMLENKRSQYVYENKIGARRVKVNKDIWIDQLGRSRTNIDYEITREDFFTRAE